MANYVTIGRLELVITFDVMEQSTMTVTTQERSQFMNCFVIVIV